MRIAVIGLGYVGAVTSACFAKAGHDVVGVDVNQTKVDQINTGLSPIVEPGLSAIIAESVAAGCLEATTSVGLAVGRCDYTIVCVGTPSTPTGDVRLTELLAVVAEIGQALRSRASWHLVAITSTVPPGTVGGEVATVLSEQSGKQIGSDIGLIFSPEFLRESAGVSDFTDPEKTVLGADDERSMEAALELYAPFARNVITTSVNTAEMVKFVDNAWHALKVTFANEVGRFCEAYNIDSQEVMDVFKADKRLNISTAYLTPGFAFGGSCLPKDLRTFIYRAQSGGVNLPVIDAILTSNRAHVDAAFERIQTLPGRRIGLLGIAFKAGTDDLRESPLLDLAERLLGKGYSVTVHDQSVAPSRLIGANREYVLGALPHIAEMLRDDVEDVIAVSDIIIVGQTNPIYKDVASRVVAPQVVLDFTGIARPKNHLAHYHGLLW